MWRKSIKMKLISKENMHKNGNDVHLFFLNALIFCFYVSKRVVLTSVSKADIYLL